MNVFTSSLAALLFGGVIFVNYLANALPINGRNTGEISDAYGNLFAPPGFTFSIWGLIYTMLLVFVVYQFGLFDTKNYAQKVGLLKKIFPYFSINMIANMVWVFLWHYDYIFLSLLVMIILLATLIQISLLLQKETFSFGEKVCIKWPFSVYFGWITVATIANVTVFLVSIEWSGFGIAESVWTSMVLLLGTLVGLRRMIKDTNVVYGLVFVWAYGGILTKHVSFGGFSGQYPDVIVTVTLCLSLFFVFGIRMILMPFQKK